MRESQFRMVTDHDSRPAWLGGDDSLNFQGLQLLCDLFAARADHVRQLLVGHIDLAPSVLGGQLQEGTPQARFNLGVKDTARNVPSQATLSRKLSDRHSTHMPLGVERAALATAIPVTLLAVSTLKRHIHARCVFSHIIGTYQWCTFLSESLTDQRCETLNSRALPYI